MVEKKVMYGIAILIAIVSLILSFTGLPGPYDTEPILALGLLLVALAGVMKNNS